MARELKKHINYYICLSVVLILGVFLILQPSTDKNLKMMIITIISIFYVFWGILHHLLHHDLNIKIMIEYILIGVLGLSVVLFFIKG